MSDFSHKLPGSYSTLTTTANHACVANRYALTLIDYKNRTVRNCTLKKDSVTTNTCIACQPSSCVRVMLGYQSGEVVVVNTEFNSLITNTKFHEKSVVDAQWPDSSDFAVSISGDKLVIWDSTTFGIKSHIDMDGLCVRCHPLDNALVATGHPYKAVVWDLRSHSSTSTVHAHLCDVHTVSWSATTASLLMTCDRKGVTKVHDIRNPSQPIWTSSFDAHKVMFSPYADYAIVHYKTGDVHIVVPPTVQGREPQLYWRQPNSVVVRQLSSITTPSALHIATLDDASCVRKYDISTSVRANPTPSTTVSSPTLSASRSMFDLLAVLKSELRDLKGMENVKVLYEKSNPDTDSSVVVAIRVQLEPHSFNSILPLGSNVAIIIRAVLSLDYPQVNPRWQVGPCDLLGWYSVGPHVLGRLNDSSVLGREEMCGLAPGTHLLISYLSLQEYDSTSFVYCSTGTMMETEIAQKSFSLNMEPTRNEHTALCTYNNTRIPRVVILPHGLIVRHKKHEVDPVMELFSEEESTVEVRRPNLEELSVQSSNREIWKIISPVFMAGPSAALRASFTFGFLRLLKVSKCPDEAALCVLAAMKTMPSGPCPIPSGLIFHSLLCLRLYHRQVHMIPDFYLAHDVRNAMYRLCSHVSRYAPHLASIVSLHFSDVALGDGGESRFLANVPLDCAICWQRCRGLMHFCPSCGHGGHRDHIGEWFLTENECPTGCGCQCKECYGVF